MLFQPEAALQNETSDTCDGGKAGTLILWGFLALKLKGEMLKYVSACSDGSFMEQKASDHVLFLMLNLNL